VSSPYSVGLSGHLPWCLS